MADTTTEPRLHVTTATVRDMLRKRYAAPEWALMEEVAPETGGGTRYADAIAVNLWRSRGHAVHGFEVKVSRSDWLRELKAPEKAEPLFRYCDHWFIVAPKGVVKDGELPPTWGLLEVRASGLVAIKAAPKLEAQPITRAFFASMMRRGYELLDRAAELKIVGARAEIEERVRAEVARRVQDSTRELHELKRHLQDLKDATGIEVSRYTGPPKNVIQLAQKLQYIGGFYGGDDGFKGLQRLAGQLTQAAGTIYKALEELEPVAPQELPSEVPHG